MPKVGPRPGLGMLTGGDGVRVGLELDRRPWSQDCPPLPGLAGFICPRPTQDPSPRHLLPAPPAWRSHSGTMGVSPSTLCTLCHPADLAQGLLPCSPPVPTQQGRLAQVSLSQ